MTSEVLKTIIISSMGGAIVGVLLKTAFEIPYTKRLIAEYEEEIADWRRLYRSHVEDWRNMVSRYQQRVIELEAEKAERDSAAVKKAFEDQIKTPVVAKPTEIPDWYKFFLDLDTLPEGEIDLDFPNSREEGE